ncbi:hypothetical protein [Prevotella nigrescens]
MELNVLLSPISSSADSTGMFFYYKKTAAKPHRIPSAGIGNSLSAAIFPSGGSDRKSCIVEAADKNKGGGTEHP